MAQSPPSERLPSVLLVDDDEDDLFFLRRRLASSGVKNPVVAFSRPHDMIQYLGGGLEGGGASPPGSIPPCLIFTDIKMPGMNGFELLQWIRQQGALRDVTVYVISGSSLPADRMRAAELSADGYLVKFPEASVFADCVAGSMAKLAGGKTPSLPPTHGNKPEGT